MLLSLAVAHIVLPAALLWVVFTDLVYRRIANWVVVGLQVCWLVSVVAATVQHGFTPYRSALADGLLSATLTLAVGYLLFAMRWVGAGDVKLMATLCLWSAEQAPTFLVVTSLAGGLLALSMPLVRRVENVLVGIIRRLTKPTSPLRQTSSIQGLPYGLAIAAGAAFVLHGH